MASKARSVHPFNISYSTVETSLSWTIVGGSGADVRVVSSLLRRRWRDLRRDLIVFHERRAME